MRIRLGAVILAAILSACATTPADHKAHLDADIEEAANDMEDSKRDYEDCLREQEEDEEWSCDEFKDMYEEDQQAYERLLRKKAASR